jgi:UDP-N-acetylglucosamine 1-carboxyvinyltransferase
MEGPTTDRYVVNGGKPLNGTVTISGAKNAAVAIIPAAILADEPCIIENVPQIDDVYVLKAILEKIGAVVEFLDERTMKIDPRPITTYSTTFDLVRKMRASYYLAGAMLGKFNRAEVALPGGCDLGPRPIDQHLKGMAALGAESSIDEGILKLKAAELTGGEIYLDIVSVGATINIMLAASRAKGNTVIVNAAKEPHVVDVANFLNMMGASIKGAGTDIIRITGRDHLHGCSYAVIPDQVEAATFMIAAAATKGDVIIKNIIPTHLEAISAKLMEMGAYCFRATTAANSISASAPVSAHGV